jgi:hypothetical protein
VLQSILLHFSLYVQTSAVAERHVDTAKAALQQLELLQRELRIHPTVEVVQQIMDLYRQVHC